MQDSKRIHCQVNIVLSAPIFTALLLLLAGLLLMENAFGAIRGASSSDVTLGRFPNVRFTHLMANKNIALGEVKVFKEDRFGFMWVGGAVGSGAFRWL